MLKYGTIFVQISQHKQMEWVAGGDETFWKALKVSPGSEMNPYLYCMSSFPRQTNTVIMTLFMHLHKKSSIPNKKKWRAQTKVFLCRSKFMCQSKINKLTNQPSPSFHLSLTTALGYYNLDIELEFRRYQGMSVEKLERLSNNSAPNKN